MFGRTSGVATLALALTLPIAACESNTTGNEYGSVSLQLTDGNGEEIQEAWVTFTDIYLQGDSGEADPPTSRVYLMQDELQEFELTGLAGGVADLVTGAEVPTGDYGQLRVVLQDACIVTPAGVFSSSPSYTKCGEPDGTINMTSTTESGFKVQLHGLHVDGTQQILLLDFVVNESFLHETGNPNRYNLYPVIHAADISLTGGFDVALNVADTVSLPSPFTPDSFSVTMTPAEGDAETVAFADNDGDGVYEAHFQYEQPGQDYTFTLNGPVGLDFTSDPAGEQVVTLDNGDTGAVAWTITSASATTTP